MSRKKTFKDYTDLGSISAELVLKNFPFVFFISFLAMIYIANAHYSEKQVRQIQDAQAELKQMRWKYMSLKSEFTFKAKRSEVVKLGKDIDLKSNNKKPNKIILKREQ
ncbi:MAG: hypothetical protein ACI8P3_002326 [Saprospiraceae bacterium]|jgi:hypothetical protein